MGVYDYVKSIQLSIPNAYTVRTLIFCLGLVMIVLLVSVIKIHRYTHLFWKNKPVAFSTVFSMMMGKIEQHTSLSTDHDVLPPDYTVVHISDVQALLKNTGQIDRLLTLWKLCACKTRLSTVLTTPGDVVDPTTMPPTPPPLDKHDMLSILQQPHCELLLMHYIGSGDVDHIVGSLVCCPTTLNTPIQDSEEVYIAQQLCVDPTHRHKRLAPCLMNHALHIARKRHACEPVALFAVPWEPDTMSHNRLPFAEVFRSMRVCQLYQPHMLLDDETEVTYNVITSFDELPARAFECSDTHITNHPTLELSTDTMDHRKYWHYVLKQPRHVVLAVSGTDWIHLRRRSRCNTPHYDCILFVEGFSFQHKDTEQVVPHIFKYMKDHCADERRVLLVLPQPLSEVFDEHSYLKKEPQHKTWTYYDADYIYMYNYRLNSVKVHVPYTMHYHVLRM